MALAVDAIDRHDPINEIRTSLVTVKEDQVKTVLVIYIAAKDILGALNY